MASASTASSGVTDAPASGRGRAYLVARGLEHDGYDALRALVADYVHQAGEHDLIPMLHARLPGLGDQAEDVWE